MRRKERKKKVIKNDKRKMMQKREGEKGGGERKSKEEGERKAHTIIRKGIQENLVHNGLDNSLHLENPNLVLSSCNSFICPIISFKLYLRCHVQENLKHTGPA